MTEKYRFEELDRETRDYLRAARDRDGADVPGIFVRKPDYLPLVGLLLGFLIIVVTVVITIPPTDPPVKEALLQTAGLVLGGWLVLAAVRVWMSGKVGGYAGHFVYADPDYLYDASGAEIEVIDLADLREVKGVANTNEGKFQSTSLRLRFTNRRAEVSVPDEVGARRMTMFLNAVCYMRDGGENGKDEDLRNLPPEAMGATAKLVAISGEFPANPARAEIGNGIRVPHPQRTGRRSTGFVGLVLVAAAGTGIFLGLEKVNYPFRDEAVFAQIEKLPAKEQPPALRMYLANDKFTAHRDDARRLLGERYAESVTANINGTDRDLKRGLTEVVLALKDKPTGAVSLRTLEARAPLGKADGTAQRQKNVGERLADKWAVTIGDELVAFATLDDPDLPANIDLRWRFTDAGSIVYTITFRKSPDEEPVLTAADTVPAAADPGKTVDAMCDQVLAASVGTIKLRAIVPLEF